ncbi:MAG: adenylyl-sulfate kinase [Burkholderiales bacterium]
MTSGKSGGRGSDAVVWQHGRVSAVDRERLLGQRPMTVWFTGLPGSGKTTLAFELERRLTDQGRACFVLDGDNVRHGLNGDLGFAPADRRENIRRVAEVAHLMNQAGLIVVAAFITPYDADRRMAREIIGADRFLEVYLSADLETCERRDPKGLYAKARAGTVTDFTGVSAPYEVPREPALVLATDEFTVGECVDRLLFMVTARTSGPRVPP